MGEWKRVKLGELIRPVSETYHAKHDLVVLVNTSDVFEGKITNHLLVPNENLAGQFKKTFQKGDILFSEIRPANKRYALVAQNDTSNYIASTKLMVLRLVDKTVDLQFIYHFLTSNCMLTYLQSRAEDRSGTFPQITFESELNDFVLDLPDLSTQRRIAAVLGALDDKIEVNRKICENLEAQAQALFKAWFVDFEPFGGKRPEGWKEVGLPEVFYFQEGPGIRNWQYVAENGVRFINIRCIVNGDIWVDSANMISEEEANGKYSHFLLQENDIVMSCSGTLGRYAIVRKDHLPLCLNTSVIRFRPKNGFADFSWLYGYLGSEEFLSQQKALANGSVQANFGPTHLKNMKVMLPDAVTREKYHQAIYSSIQKAQTVREENKTLAAMRDALLPKLMSGELAVEKVAV